MKKLTMKTKAICGTVGVVMVLFGGAVVWQFVKKKQLRIERENEGLFESTLNDEEFGTM